MKDHASRAALYWLTLLLASSNALLTGPTSHLCRQGSRHRKGFPLKSYGSSPNDERPRIGGGSNSGETFEIPVLGPFINAPPLIIGASMWLDPPTPLQWKTIEVCVDASANEGETKTLVEETWDEDDAVAMATIDAAPLVAILQEASAYATVAAIVGYKSSSTSGYQVDTFDTASLRESMSGVSSSPFYKDGIKVRLLGIGRAKLSDLAAKEEKDGQLTSDRQEYTNEEMLEEECSTSDSIIREPVMVAKMELILDSAIKLEKQGGVDFKFSSPVHAINKLSMWSSRIGFLHKDRQRLVQGIQAVQTRLEMLSEEWQDWDGIGDIYENPALQESSKYDPNAAFQSKIDNLLESLPNTAPNHAVDGFSQSRFLSSKAAEVLEMENFGLGSTRSAFSDLQALTDVMLEKLQGFYSPERVQTEEFQYSLFSWVALQSMMAYLPRSEIQAAMISTNTAERLEMIYDTMMWHKEALRELANAKGQELRDCGEECELF